MNTYFIRTTANDYPQLIALGVLLGAIVEVEGEIHAPNGAWDYIGAIYKDEVSLKDPQGREYIHINIITPINLADAAAELAADHPEVAEAIDNLGRFFLLDAEGNARAPEQPYRVFAA